MFIGHIAMRGYGVLAVVERSSGRLIGRSGPWFPEGWPALEVGWVIERPRWGQGFATEAAAASLDYCWRELGATVVCSLIRPENIRSIRVAERLGARRDGTIADFLGGPVAVYLHSPPG